MASFGLSGSLLILLFHAVFCSSIPESVERPCGDANSVDTACVRAQFAARSGCTPVTTVEGLDPYVAPDVTMFTNIVNITLFKKNSVYTGLSKSVIVDYSIDHNSNLNILVVNIADITANGPLDIFIHRVGQPSLKVSTVYEDHYYNLLVTLLIPGTGTLDLNKRQSYHIQTEKPVISFGDDNLTTLLASDSLVASVAEAVNKNLSVVVNDALYYMTKVMLDAFVSRAVCSLPGRELFYQENVL